MKIMRNDNSVMVVLIGVDFLAEAIPFLGVIEGLKSRDEDSHDERTLDIM